jgi:hypothetical protein
MFFPKLLDAPGRSARQQERADENQQKQRHANDQARLLHRVGSSSGYASLGIGFDRPGENGSTIQTFALPARSCDSTLFISKSRRKPRKRLVADNGGK